jgi:hypothetical protein
MESMPYMASPGMSREDLLEWSEQTPTQVIDKC